MIASNTKDEDTVELLRQRVAAFSLIFGSILLLSLVARAVGLVVWSEHLAFVPPGTVPLQSIGTLAILGIWALTRRGPRTARFIRVVEATGVVISGAAFVAIAVQMTFMVTGIEPIQALIRDPEFGFFGVASVLVPLVGASFILTYVMVLRAAFVPTSVRHTVGLTTVVGAPLAIVAWFVGGEIHSPLPFSTPLALSIGALWQWGLTVVISASISRHIYGLRAQAREAKRLGQYKLEALIGEGGMGRVYRASHVMLRRPTAIKLLLPDRAGDRAIERFEREVRLTAELTHPNTVTIFDYGRTDQGVLYYAMELLDGATLEEVVDVDGPQPAARVVRILTQVAGALGEAHAIGLIHRDVKPANIVLSRQGGELDVAKVVDFGLVKELPERQAAAVSQEGTIAGTPLYMAPEVLRSGEHAGPASDLYALGAVGYYLLTGTHVFSGESVIEVLGHHLHTVPEPPSARLGDEVPADLERLILQCLSKSPSDRPASAIDLRTQLEACEGVGRWSQRRAAMWWDAHGQSLTERRTAPPDLVPRASQNTVAVDLVRRGRARVESAE